MSTDDCNRPSIPEDQQTTSPPQEESNQEPEQIFFAEFLESISPSEGKKVKDFLTLKTSSGAYELNTSEIQLHCSDDNCNGMRFFRYIYRSITPNISITSNIEADRPIYFYLTYRCSNCQRTTKTFSLMARLDKNLGSAWCLKFGEFPAYGPPTPSRLIKLIGPDRDLFLKGRRCENQGLGIGAFVYYRRVVENQKNRILGEIVKVLEKIDASPEVITTLKDAIKETQFSKALESVKDALPQVLLINGHNPLTLLHTALSDGLHDKKDEQCLEIAHDVRVVLAELSERLGQVLKDEAELNNALSRLMKVKESK